MLVLFETCAGYAIFKLLDSKKLKETEDLYKDFESPESANKILKLKHFEKFADTTEALSAATAAVEGKLSKSLKKLLKKSIGEDVQDQLLVADAKLGSAIKEKLSLQCLSNNSVLELMRCIRLQSDSLLSSLAKEDMAAMSLGLAHSLSRYNLKFSPDKIDTMIIQSINLLDDLDKELNNYVMRCREWYGWHFPELGKIITDNVAFVKTIKFMGMRENAADTDLSDILPEHIEEQVKAQAQTSFGTEISEDDILNIQSLCEQVIEISNYRTTLHDYLSSRMMAMAPNVTVLVEPVVGARLIAHVGSLTNLAKSPASTIQILGAEKALFRALKTKKDTPKYGLLYHSQLIGRSSTKNKGKMSRSLAAKVALASRVDALGEDVKFDLGTEHKAKLEARLRVLEEGNIKRISGTGKAKAKFEKYQGVSEVKHYPTAGDSTLTSVKRKRSESEAQEVKSDADVTETPKQKKKKAKKERKQSETSVKVEPKNEESQEETTPVVVKKKKVKQEVKQEVMEESIDEPSTSTKKKKKKAKKIKEEVEED